jgi:hypothetical protein
LRRSYLVAKGTHSKARIGTHFKEILQHLLQVVLYGLSRSYNINTGTEIEERYNTFRRSYCTDFEVTVQQKIGMKIEGKYKFNKSYCMDF